MLHECRLSAFLDNVDVGDYVVQGDIEAYSCALASLLDVNSVLESAGTKQPLDTS